jgi:serine/threonine protein kinase
MVNFAEWHPHTCLSYGDTGKMIDTPDESLYRTMRKEGKKSIHRERILAYSTVGTPDYIAPEVLSQKVSDGCATGVMWNPRYFCAVTHGTTATAVSSSCIRVTPSLCSH